jgi:N-acetylneuraminic acid mutarotase
MPTPRAMAAAGVIDGKLYVAGGSLTDDFQTSLPILEVFDPLTGQWATGAPMATERTAALGAVAGGALYVMGGLSSIGQFLDTVERYDPRIGTWSPAASIRGLGRDALGCGAATVDGKIYIRCAGALDSKVYDPTLDQWSFLDVSGVRRAYFGTAAIGDTVYTVGGSEPDGVVATMDVYDTSTGGSSQGPPMPTSRRSCSAGAVGGKLYVAGGVREVYGPGIAVTESYDPATGIWADESPMAEPRIGAAAAVVDGKLFVAGGFAELREGWPNEALAAVEFFVPTSPDRDGDGVSDDVDRCPGTAPDTSVDPADGCSIAQLCPCERPAGNHWRSHGDYVSCGARETNRFVGLGLLERAARGKSHAGAANSVCGR